MAPTPSAAEGSPTGGQQKPSSSPGFLVAGPALWWRGLKVAWRARWPFWVPVGLALYDLVWFLRTFGQTPLHERVGVPSMPPWDPSEPLAFVLARQALNCTWFEGALHIDGYPGFLLSLIFTASLWLLLLKRNRPQSKRLAFTVAIISGAVVLQYVVPRALATWSALFWEQVLKTRAGTIDREVFFASLGPRAKIGALLQGLSLITTPIAVAWLGSLFWGAASGARPRPWRALARAYDCILPLLIYYTAVATPDLVRLAWGLICLANSAKLAAGAFEVYWPYGPVFVAAVLAWLCQLLLETVGLPFPFLVLSGKAPFWQALTSLFSLWRRRWRSLVSLWLVTALPRAGLGAVSLAAGGLSGDYWTLLTMQRIASAPMLLLSIGGCMGVFLLIEEWRTHGATSGQGVER